MTSPQSSHDIITTRHVSRSRVPRMRVTVWLLTCFMDSHVFHDQPVRRSFPAVLSMCIACVDIRHACTWLFLFYFSPRFVFLFHVRAEPSLAGPHKFLPACSPSWVCSCDHPCSSVSRIKTAPFSVFCLPHVLVTRHQLHACSLRVRRLFTFPAFPSFFISTHFTCSHPF